MLHWATLAAEVTTPASQGATQSGIFSGWKLFLGCGAFIYGVVAVYRIATGKSRRGAAPGAATQGYSREEIAHVMFWTFVPPLWFAWEGLGLTRHQLEDIKGAQESAAKIWAAVLAAILFLLKKEKEGPE